MDLEQRTSARIDVSLVIPTFNERDSVRPLLDAISSAMCDLSWNALFVDDSDDGTDDVIAAIAAEDPRVAVLHRVANRGGLAGAVSDGLQRVATGTYVCVIDADLQHPPSVIRQLIAEARRTDADVVIASRYIPGGSTGGLDGPMRQLYSRGLKLLSQALFPQRLAGVTDPLGGFFLVRRSVLQGVRLRPIGYKILLEVLIRCDWRTSAEVPYSFEARQHGESKANLQQGLQFLKHLRTLFWDCSPLFAMPRLAMRLSAGGRSAPVPGSS